MRPSPRCLSELELRFSGNDQEILCTLGNICHSETLDKDSFSRVAEFYVSFGLFRKNLGNLRKFFGQMVHRPPGKKLPVRLRSQSPDIGLSLQARTWLTTKSPDLCVIKLAELCKPGIGPYLASVFNSIETKMLALLASFLLVALVNAQRPEPCGKSIAILPPIHITVSESI